MIKRVVSIDAYHNDRVGEVLKNIQRDGYSVTKIRRIERMTFGIFGNDVTDIYYEKE
jgi:hypothetical protein